MATPQIREGQRAPSYLQTGNLTWSDIVASLFGCVGGFALIIAVASTSPNPNAFTAAKLSFVACLALILLLWIYDTGWLVIREVAASYVCGVVTGVYVGLISLIVAAIMDLSAS